MCQLFLPHPVLVDIVIIGYNKDYRIQKLFIRPLWLEPYNKNKMDHVHGIGIMIMEVLVKLSKE